MLSENQLTEIRNYLLTRKLPIDILIEVQDHFVSQILHLEKEQNLDFEESFANVKETWRKELTLSWKGEMSLMDSTDFMRKMSKQILKSDILQSMKILIPYILILIVLANFAGSLFFQIVFTIMISLPILYCIINYIRHYKDFRLPKKNPNLILTLHQDGILWFVLTLSPFLNIIRYIFDDANLLQKMFILNFSELEILNVILGYLLIFLLLCGIAYSIVCQKKYLQQIKKVKLFLNLHQI